MSSRNESIKNRAEKRKSAEIFPTRLDVSLIITLKQVGQKVRGDGIVTF